MVIAKTTTLLEVLAELIERNRKMGVDPKHMDFLIKVYGNAYRDKSFAECLETCIDFSTGFAPTLDAIERVLVRMDGGIRPLMEEKGIVQPLPEVKEEV